MAREITPKSKVTFALHAPEAGAVRLAGCFTHWQDAAVNLRKQKDGTWKTTLSLPPGTYEYRFLVDGEWRDDPACLSRKPNSFGSQNCIRVVPGG
jgi:1,4-alpha-glucan branching enzyme